MEVQNDPDLPGHSIGPPGTGKTGAIRDTVEAWVNRDGYAPEDIVLTSFTRSAAAVLSGRIEVPHQNVATLHALAYRALGSPPMAEAGELAKRWNEGHAHLPAWQVGGGLSNEEDGLAMPDAEMGEMMRLYSLARSRLVPPGHPLFEVTRQFARAWEDWKAETASIDFCDMLMNAAMYVPALDQPVFIVDEAQDLVPLQWSLVRQWGSQAERFVVAGDAGQAIYTFAGARPDDLLTPLPDEKLWPLTQSYRMPRAVLEHAERHLSQHSGAMMQGRQYAPRLRGAHPDDVGAVRAVAATWKRPEGIVDMIEQDPRDCMVLASCSYMLQPLVAELRSRGIPFGNRWRRSNGSWNPLAGARATGTKRSTARMIASFARGDEPKEWLDLLKAEVFVMRSAKKMIEEGGEDLVGMLRPEHRDAYEARDLRWLYQHMPQQYRRPAEYAVEVIARNGVDILADEPRVTVGSIHSVKGAEAKVVYVCPDTSVAGGREANDSQEGADSAVRLGYVALTRASEEVVLADAADPARSMW